MALLLTKHVQFVRPTLNMSRIRRVLWDFSFPFAFI
jgi:hypothetical protein